LLNRWTAAGDPEEWASGPPFTQETGIIHNTLNSIKLVPTVTAQYPVITIDADAKKALLGHWANFTLWVKIATGQTFSAYPYIQLYVTCPDWTAATAYEVGDAVFDVAATSGKMFLCIAAGTSHATDEPVRFNHWRYHY
jgi:hypothetical protein